jgi:hypothetical protein
MSDIGNQQLFENNCRRKILFSGTALLAVCFSAQASFASGGGDGGDGGEQSDENNSSGNKTTVQMSQAKFRSLSNWEVYRLSDRDSNNEIIFELDGFSTNMSKRILYMSAFEPGSVRRLLKDMSKLKTKEARKKRLDEEIDRVTRLKKLLEDSMKRLKAKTGTGAKSAADAEWVKWVDTKAYLQNLKVWRRFPNEGTR